MGEIGEETSLSCLLLCRMIPGGSRGDYWSGPLIHLYFCNSRSFSLLEGPTSDGYSGRSRFECRTRIASLLDDWGDKDPVHSLPCSSCLRSRVRQGEQSSDRNTHKNYCLLCQRRTERRNIFQPPARASGRTSPGPGLSFWTPFRFPCGHGRYCGAVSKQVIGHYRARQHNQYPPFQSQAYFSASV